MTFRIHNTVLTLRFGFFAVLAVLLTLDGGVHVLPALLAVAVHETGHILAAKLCGMQIKSVTFGALGRFFTKCAAQQTVKRGAAVQRYGGQHVEREQRELHGRIGARQRQKQQEAK